jgi:SAM-dependent methyltransferase
MIRLADRYASAGGRCRYRVGSRPDLRDFDDGTFDLVCAILVLQHIPPPFAAAYVREFGRVAAPGGVILFQAPHARRRPLPRRGLLRRIAARVLRSRRVALEMYALPREVVERTLREAGCEIVDVKPDGWAGEDWESFVYLARKR